MRISIRPPSKSVEWAANPGRATVKDMGIDDRRLHVAMAKKSLNRTDIMPIFEQMGREGMSGAQGFTEKSARHF